MIKKLIRKLIGDKNNSAVNRRRIARAEHGVKEELISPCAIRIVKTLQRSGFEAYIVGGAVRDLLLGREPKDFDVVTDATPEEVRALFRQSRIIGRRFRLVHVRCGRELVEVSTYRAPHQNGRAHRTGKEGSSETIRSGPLMMMRFAETLQSMLFFMIRSPLTY